MRCKQICLTGRFGGVSGLDGYEIGVRYKIKYTKKRQMAQVWELSSASDLLLFRLPHVVIISASLMLSAKIIFSNIQIPIVLNNH